MTNETGLPSKPRAEPRLLRGRARALTLEIAAEARAEWAYTSDVIARAFRTHRELGSGERRHDRRDGLWPRALAPAAGRHRRGDAARRRAQPSGETRDELLLVAYEARQGAEPAATADRAAAAAAARAASARLLAARVRAEEAGLGSTRARPGGAAPVLPHLAARAAASTTRARREALRAGRGHEPARAAGGAGQHRPGRARRAGPRGWPTTGVDRARHAAVRRRG